ncbi:MAG: uracil-DNA glycosylase [Rhizobiaceae bacterium]|nr:uracil-DNA glycosylase [Rhizobiaceae bacterium]
MSPAAPDKPANLEELLRFYAEAGHDEALTEEPINRFAKPARAATEGKAQPKRAGTPPLPSPGAPPPGQRVTVPAPPAPTTVPDEQQAMRARALAREAKTIEELYEALAGFDGCNLKVTAKNLVFADGNPQARIMLVGEAPGRDEDIQGLPFVGRSGQLLDRMLAAIGLDRTSAYISNVIPWRPPGNRDPSPLETEICRPFIERHIELVAPKVLVTLGNPSTKLLLGTQTGIMRMRGKWAEHETAGGAKIATMPTLHPAYLLRNPAHKKLAWRDFLEVKMRLNAPD